MVSYLLFYAVLTSLLLSRFDLKARGRHVSVESPREQEEVLGTD